MDGPTEFLGATPLDAEFATRDAKIFGWDSPTEYLGTSLRVLYLILKTLYIRMPHGTTWKIRA